MIYSINNCKVLRDRINRGVLSNLTGDIKRTSKKSTFQIES